MSIRPIEILIRAKDEFSGMLGSMQTKIAAVAVAIAGFFGISLFSGAVKSAAEFEAAMSRVQAATGASAEELGRLKQAAEEAGANTKYTSVQAAEALENLAKAGLTATQAIEALPAVLALAEAGDVALGTSAEFVTKAVMGMGLQFSDAARVADVLALGANATNTSVKGLAEALSYAAPTAQSLGLSLETTVAIIGKFADAGIDASRAGTALNSIMSQFSDPASKFRNELAAIGITTGDFNQALHQLADSGARGSKAINAVGLEAGPALKALLNQGMPALDELKAKLDNAAGSAAATAKTMGDNLTGSMTGLGSAWDTVKTVLGTPVLPVLKDGVDQLAGALRGLVADGTIAKFGESFAEAFRAAIKWARDFFDQIDFKVVVADMQAFAAQAGETFRSIGEHAAMAGNAAQTAYGVMSAGVNTVLGAVYLIGEAFAGVASNIQSGLALIYDAFAKVTFGSVSAAYKQAADDMRLSAEATWAASEELGKKSTAAFIAVADGAQTARDGFAGLAKSATDAKPVIDQASKAMADMATELQKTAEANAAARKATEEKAAADQAAKQSADDNRAAIAQLREEYAALIASGNLQGAAEKLQEINKALQGTPAAAGDAAKAAADAAAQIDAAFGRLGVTSSAALKEQAAAAQRDYETIKNAGTSTAQDIGSAFKVAADKAIAANAGIAPSWVEAQAAARGYEIAVDSAGKATLRLAGATDTSTGSQHRHARAIDDTRTALEKLNAEKEREISAQEKANDLKEREAELERKKRGVDKDGFVTDNNGKRLTMTVHTRESVYNQAKGDGFDDAAAIKLAESFNYGQWTGPNASDVNKKLAVAKVEIARAKVAAEELMRDIARGKVDGTTLNPGQRYTLEAGGLQVPVTKNKNEPPAKEQAKSAPAPVQAPASAPWQSGGTASVGGDTYISNITLSSGRKETVRFADAQSQTSTERLLRDLAAGKGVAQ